MSGRSKSPRGESPASSGAPARSKGAPDRSRGAPARSLTFQAKSRGAELFVPEIGHSARSCDSNQGHSANSYVRNATFGGRGAGPLPLQIFERAPESWDGEGLSTVPRDRRGAGLSPAPWTRETVEGGVVPTPAPWTREARETREGGEYPALRGPSPPWRPVAKGAVALGRGSPPPPWPMARGTPRGPKRTGRPQHLSVQTARRVGRPVVSAAGIDRAAGEPWKSAGGRPVAPWRLCVRASGEHDVWNGWGCRGGRPRSQGFCFELLAVLIGYTPDTGSCYERSTASLPSDCQHVVYHSVPSVNVTSHTPCSTTE